MSHDVKQAQQAVWLDPDSFATTLLTLYIDTFGAVDDETADDEEKISPLDWDPATMVLEIEEHWNIALPVIAFDRLQAAIQIATTDRFYKDVEAFEALCNVLSGTHYQPSIWDPADALEIAWGITEALFLARPDQKDPEPFIPEILGYIGQALKAEGIMQPPDVLRLGTPNLRQLEQVQHEFSDDPAMFEIIYTTEAKKTAAIEETVGNRLRELVAQLQRLPLVHGRSQDFLAHLKQEQSA